MLSDLLLYVLILWFEYSTAQCNNRTDSAGFTQINNNGGLHHYRDMGNFLTNDLQLKI